ncbi:Nramp family divalent metal transporter [Rhodococcoides corynebacterioides]|uniref:Nramp family divalent metal transporter n=1 Tax=Rhodococcoides corynebacterioides TaxID=53972 RepID=A0ABS7P572_9NOCA|nr:Nramp family divalent metal transporter [Rhodococcus corynebacterioides]MBY6367166.1 Nramp family divalent metal transporter [Rhodococcus corynebacterioides]MBY6407420.1 Nramp family divalent metal transporter [Rhodococcus corynebacterioides]
MTDRVALRAVPRRTRPVALLGPAFVAAIAYVDPGNVAANLTAGARYGYLLVWVLVAANAMAVLVQYLSAKLGLVSGRSLPEVLGDRMRPATRRAFWVQAEAVAVATDVAEVIGGAIALNLLFGLPLPVGGLVTGVVSMIVLAVQSRRGQRTFEFVVIGMLAVITVGFLTGLFFTDLDPAGIAGGVIPGFDGSDSVLLAASMLGATVMPHAIYLHSALARDRHGVETDPVKLDRLLRATKFDVTFALLVAGTVNIGMLLLAASSLLGREGTDTIDGAHAAIESTLGTGVAAVFAVGLLASGLASTAVGCAAGAEIMKGLLRKRIPIQLRRVITLIPALIVLGVGVDPTLALVLSQVVLSMCIPFALIPLVRLTSNRAVMGERVNSRTTVALATLATSAIVALNVALLWLTVTGRA